MFTRVTASALAALLIATIPRVSAQSSPAFEVASVRRTPPGSVVPAEALDQLKSRARIQLRKGGRIAGYHTALIVYLQMAYELPPDRITRPSWMDSELYDILAKMPPDTSDDDALRMLQSLLTERFHLKIRREQRSTSAYALLVAKGGPKLTPSTEDESPTVRPDPNRLQVSARSLDGFASVLSYFVGMPVINLTGISGVYNYTLRFAPEPSGTQAPHSPLQTTYSGLPASLSQVGLRLESRKMLLDFLIVDGGNKTPDEN
jgi:uncharacterized protein (TIGR03435 family)